MKKHKPLSATNPYIKDPEIRAKMIRASVISSSAIEGVHSKNYRRISPAKLKPSPASHKS